MSEHSEQIDIKTLEALSMLDVSTIKTDIHSYIANVFTIIDKFLEVDTRHVKIKPDLATMDIYREDNIEQYDHPITKPIQVDRIVKK